MTKTLLSFLLILSIFTKQSLALCTGTDVTSVSFSPVLGACANPINVDVKQAVSDNTCSDCSDIKMQFCIAFKWQGGAEFLHGYQLDLTGPWHNMGTVGAPSTWQMFAAGCGSGSCGGAGSFGPGFYYRNTLTTNCGPALATTPCDNFGFPGNVDFEFTFSADICACSIVGGVPPPITFILSSDGASGGSNLPGCAIAMTIQPASITAPASVCCPNPAFTSPTTIYCNSGTVNLTTNYHTTFPAAGGWTGSGSSCVTSVDAACGSTETVTFDPCCAAPFPSVSLTHTVGYDSGCQKNTTQALTVVKPVYSMPLGFPTEYCGTDCPNITSLSDVANVKRSDNGASWDGPAVTVALYEDAACTVPFTCPNPLNTCSSLIKTVYVKLNTGCANCDIANAASINVTFYPLLVREETNNACDQTVNVRVGSIVGPICNTWFDNVCNGVVGGQTFFAGTTCEQTIAGADFVETNPPSADPLPDVFISCYSELPAPDINILTNLNDDCTGAPTVAFVNDVPNTIPGCDGSMSVINRTYSITDDCGNQTFINQLFNIFDNTPPTWSTPVGSLDGPVSCDGAFIWVDPVATDNCISNINITFVEDPPPGGCVGTYDIVRHYTATDCSGNASVEFLVTKSITDLTPPSWISAVGSLNTNFQCNETITWVDPISYDACDPNPSISYTEDSPVVGVCPVLYSITRHYTVTDCSNNPSVVFDVVSSVVDNTAPTWITALGSLDNSQECGTVPSWAEPTASDVCDNSLTYTFTEDPPVILSCNNNYSITRHYTATDDCNNTSVVFNETITFDDTSNPTADPLPNINVSCFADAPAPDINVVTNANDACGTVTVVWESDVPSVPVCEGIANIVRTYLVTDECNNQIILTQNINISDKIAPTWTTPIGSLDGIASCSGAVAWVEPIATDNCGASPVITFVDDPIPGGCTGTYTLTRRYTATDCAGNASVEFVVVKTVTDATAPLWNELPGSLDFSVECGMTINWTSPSALDVCDASPVITFVEDAPIFGVCPNLYTITRHYTATDCALNPSLAFDITVSLEDNTPPNWVFAPNALDATLSCNEAPVWITPLAIDLCDNALLFTYTEDTPIPGTCTSNYSITRHYTATDDCGNMSSIYDITLSFVDSDLPTADPLPVINVTCYNLIPAANINLVTNENDICGSTTVTYIGDTPSAAPSCLGAATIVRTYSVTDECGNSILLNQNINILDNIAPTASNLPDILLGTCGGVLPTPDINLVNDETDNCDVSLTVTWISDTPLNTGCGGSGSYVRTYRVSDCAGNSVDVTQNLLSNDNTEPTASNPSDITGIECLLDVPVPNPDVVTDESDDCGIVTVSFVSDLPNFTCNGSGSIIRTYRVSDCANNSILVTQNIYLQDVTPPTVLPLPSISVSCVNEIPNPDISIVTGVTDNCDTSPSIIWLSDSAPSICEGTGSIVRTYEINDCAGNSTLTTQLFILNDNIPPVINGIETSNSILCNASLPAVSPNVIDNCGETIDAILISTTTSEFDCESNSYQVTRTWQAEDCNGNISLKSQVTTVTCSPLTANATGSTSICDGASAFLNVVTTGGNTASLTYSWSPTLGLNDASISNPEASPSVTTVYTVSVTDANGCIATDIVNVVVGSCCIANAGSLDPIPNICLGSALSISIGSPVYTFGIDPTTDPLAGSNFYYAYVLTNSIGNIISYNNTGVFNINGLPEGTYCVYGISYKDALTSSSDGINLDVFEINDITDNDGTAAPWAIIPSDACMSLTNFCFEISNGLSSLNNQSLDVCSTITSDNISLYESAIGISGGTWYNNDGTLVLDPSNINPHYNESDLLTSVTFTYIVNDLSGCASSATLVYNFIPEPAAALTAPTEICAGENTILEIENLSNYPVQVTLSNGFISPFIGALSTYNLTVGSGSYAITNVASNECNSISNSNVTINEIICATGVEDLGGINSFVFFDADTNGIYSSPEFFVDANGNGVYDTGESFSDNNGNGIWDDGEPLIEGVTVLLYSNAGPDGIPGNADDFDPVAIAVTNSLGSYMFDNLPIVDSNGDTILYSLQFPQGINYNGSYVPTTYTNASSENIFDTNDSDINAFGVSVTFSLGSGQAININAGFGYVVSVGLKNINITANSSCEALNVQWNSSIENWLNYKIYTSLDANNWQLCSEIQHESNKYIYQLSENTCSEANYIKMAATLSGGAEFVKTISVEKNCEKPILEVMLYPNPVLNNSEICMEVHSNNISSNSIWQLYDAKGKLIWDRTLQITNGVNKFYAKTNQLAKGVYFSKLINGNNVYTKKIMIIE